jgi:superoxide dismutase, Cu-Zn family
MKKPISFLLFSILFLVAGIAFAQGVYGNKEAKQGNMDSIVIDLKNNNGESIGTASFEQDGDVLKLTINASGLTPGKHGFHIHENPIEGNDFNTAGSHFNPTGKKHGHLNPEGAHLGDLLNLEVDAKGNADQTFELKDVTIEKGKPNSILNKSLIIHALEDDYKTDPSGNSGDRVAGGNILN